LELDRADVALKRARSIFSADPPFVRLRQRHQGLRDRERILCTPSPWAGSRRRINRSRQAPPRLCMVGLCTDRLNQRHFRRARKIQYLRVERRNSREKRRARRRVGMVVLLFEGSHWYKSTMRLHHAAALGISGGPFEPMARCLEPKFGCFANRSRSMYRD
jgi:hypothetical protein